MIGSVDERENHAGWDQERPSCYVDPLDFSETVKCLPDPFTSLPRGSPQE